MYALDAVCRVAIALAAGLLLFDACAHSTPPNPRTKRHETCQVWANLCQIAEAQALTHPFNSLAFCLGLLAARATHLHAERTEHHSRNHEVGKQPPHVDKCRHRGRCEVRHTPNELGQTIRTVPHTKRGRRMEALGPDEGHETRLG